MEQLTIVEAARETGFSINHISNELKLGKLIGEKNAAGTWHMTMAALEDWRPGCTTKEAA